MASASAVIAFLEYTFDNPAKDTAALKVWDKKRGNKGAQYTTNRYLNANTWTVTVKINIRY